MCKTNVSKNYSTTVFCFEHFENKSDQINIQWNSQFSNWPFESIKTEDTIFKLIFSMWLSSMKLVQ